MSITLSYIATTPTSFRLRPETLEQLDRLSVLLTQKFRSQLAEHPEDRSLAYVANRDVSRVEALAVAVSGTLARVERELGTAPMAPDPYRAAADAGRGLLSGVRGGSMVDELQGERRREAAAEVATAGPAKRRRRG